jgi:hypothetical protein
VAVVRLVRRRWIALRSASESPGPLGLLVMMRRLVLQTVWPGAHQLTMIVGGPEVDRWCVTAVARACRPSSQSSR